MQGRLARRARASYANCGCGGLAQSAARAQTPRACRRWQTGREHRRAESPLCHEACDLPLLLPKGALR